MKPPVESGDESSSTAGKSDHEARSPLRFAAILAAAMAVCGLPFHVVSVLAPFLVGELAIGPTQLGIALATATATGAVLSPAAGRITDALGGRRTLLFVLGTCIVAISGVAAARAYPWLIAAMVLTGIAQGFSNPSTNWLIAHHLPRGSRGLVMGIKQSGIQMSLFTAGALLPTLALAAGWRLAALSLTAPAAVVWLFSRQVPSGGRGRSFPSVAPLRHRPDPAIRRLILFSFFMGAGQSAVTAFLPLYAVEAVDLDTTSAGAAAAVLGLVGVAGRILWSQRAERFRRIETPLIIIASASAVAAIGLLNAPVIGRGLLWLSVLVAGASVAASNAVVMLATVSLVAERSVGRASGAVFGSFLVGNSVGPPLFGALVDLSNGYRYSWIALTLAFAASAVIAARRPRDAAERLQPIV